jgi:hypothetical protein
LLSLFVAGIDYFYLKFQLPDMGLIFSPPERMASGLQ